LLVAMNAVLLWRRVLTSDVREFLAEGHLEAIADENVDVRRQNGPAAPCYPPDRR
jgi:hypothetical protein